MFKTVLQTCVGGEVIVKTWKHHSYSTLTPPQTILLKVFLQFSLIHFQSGLKKALLTSFQRATVEELFLGIYFGLFLYVDKSYMIALLAYFLRLHHPP